MKQTTSGDNNLADSVNHALNMRANIRRAFWMYFVLFALLVGNIAFFVTVQAPGLMHNPFNPRTRGETDALRGDILDSRGRVLAYSGVGAERAYPFGRDFVHIVGFDGFGRSGAEARHNLTLNAISGEIVQRVRNLAQGEPLRGNRLVLTVDADLQRLVVDQLGHSRGAVVVMEPSTGKLLAMASYPDFDPNDLAAEWNTLITDNANAPLLNRAAQGLYPP
ncbi:MAG: penicillin-binding transpeptidase domain-containing protein, partial [Defluviitaleaceae bacterium]|nr:penicillin-binding transpeptidase domain-containing protein [Defluviitaleaceae bacterium]